MGGLGSGLPNPLKFGPGLWIPLSADSATMTGGVQSLINFSRSRRKMVHSQVAVSSKMVLSIVCRRFLVATRSFHIFIYLFIGDK